MIKNKKLIKGLVIIIICLFVTFLIYNLIPKNKNYTVADINLRNNYISVLKDNKYGFIDTLGNKKIDYIYDEAEDFHYKYTKVKIGDSYKIINQNNDTIYDNISSESNYIMDDATWVINGILYDYDLKMLSDADYVVTYKYSNLYLFKSRSMNEVGILNKSGNVIYKSDGENISLNYIASDPSQVGSYSVIQVDNKYGIINNIDGKLVVELSDTLISPIGNNIFKIGDRYAYIEENRIYFESNNEFYFYNIKDDIIYLRSAMYDIKAHKFLNNMDVREIRSTSDFESKSDIEKYMGSNKKYGLISSISHKVILESDYDDIKFLDHEVYDYVNDKASRAYVLLIKDGKTILYDLNSKLDIYTFDSDKVDVYKNSTFITATDEETSNKIVFSLLSTSYGIYKDDVEIHSDYIVAKDNIYNNLLVKIY